MLMIAFDVKTTASRRLKLRTTQLETTPDHFVTSMAKQANGPCNHVARHVRHVGYLHSVFSIERTQILQGVTEIIVNTSKWPM